MSTHVTSNQLRARLTQMMGRQARDERSSALLRAQAVVAFVHRNPDLVLILDGRGEEVRVVWNSLEPAPDLVFELPDAQIAHEFWSGQLNIMTAVREKRLVMRGNLLKAIALLPGAAASQAAYRAVLAEETT